MLANYDIVLSSPFPNYDFFAHRLRELCGQLNLTYFGADKVWVNDFLQKLKNREISVRVLLDLSNNQTVPNDPYLMLAKEVKQQGGYVIDDPDITSAVAHKGFFHQIMLENNILVPETIIVSRSELDTFRVTKEIQDIVGVPFVVKPAWGDSSMGVIIDGSSHYDLLKSAEQSPKSDAFLVQRKVRPKILGDHVGWFRMFHVINEVIPCWWSPTSHEYHLVTPAQRQTYKLTPLVRIVKDIARVSKMKFFTSEICLDLDGHLYTVDYINADPDMNPRSFYATGVPDEVVRHIVWLVVIECMRAIMKKRGYFDEGLDGSDIDFRMQQPILPKSLQSKTGKSRK
jgi:hypothetical protein